MARRRPLLAAWLLVSLLLAAAVVWWWSLPGPWSPELRFWDEQTRRITGGPMPAGSMLTSPLLTLSISLLTGSPRTAALLIGSTALAVLCWTLGARRSAWWLIPIALHPVVFIGASASPTILLTTTLLAVAASCFAEHVRTNAVAPLTYGGFALGLLVLVAWDAWPLWLLIAVLLIGASGGPLPERVTRALVALFPAIFMSLAWLYLNWTETGEPFFFVRADRWREVGVASAGSSMRILTAALLAAPVLVLLPFIRTRAGGDAAVGSGSLVAELLLALSPLLLLAAWLWVGDRPSMLTALGNGLATAVAIASVTRSRLRPRLVAAAVVLLLLGSAGGWWTVASGARAAERPSETFRAAR